MKLDTLPSPAVPDIMEKSKMTMESLRRNIKVGYTDERGPAWWANGAVTKDGTWSEIPDGSHFPGAVPMEVVLAQLDVPFVKGEVHVTYTDEAGHKQVAGDPRTQPIVNQRTGQIFSYPKSGYAIHPYIETLSDFIQAIQYDQAVAVGSVGLLKDGGQAFLQARLPENLEVAGYGYAPYILAATSVDLSRSTSYSLGFLGAVCDNTVTNALAEALAMYKIKHSRYSGMSVQSIRDGLGLRLQQAGEDIGQMIADMTQVDVSDADFAAWLDEMAPAVEPKAGTKTGGAAYTNAEAKRAEYTRLWTKDEKVAPWSGTLFGILQLDNTYRTWTKGVHNAEGGRIERNFTVAASGDLAKWDAAALTTMHGIQSKRLVVATG